MRNNDVRVFFPQVLVRIASFVAHKLVFRRRGDDLALKLLRSDMGYVSGGKENESNRIHPR